MDPHFQGDLLQEPLLIQDCEEVGCTCILIART